LDGTTEAWSSWWSTWASLPALPRYLLRQARPRYLLLQENPNRACLSFMRQPAIACGRWGEARRLKTRCLLLPVLPALCWPACSSMRIRWVALPNLQVCKSAPSSVAVWPSPSCAWHTRTAAPLSAGPQSLYQVLLENIVLYRESLASLPSPGAVVGVAAGE